jgi:hypothetical protein
MPQNGWVLDIDTLNVHIADDVTVGPLNPVGMDNTNRGQLACAAVSGQYRTIGFPMSSGAGTKVEGSGLFTRVALKRHGKIKINSGSTFHFTGAGYLVYTGETAGTVQLNAPNGSGKLTQVVGITVAVDEFLVDIDPGSVNA